MSLIDKITGFALKAKDTVISKTFISKDRRLEASLSDNLRLNDIYFRKISTYGFTSTISLVAFDYVASLLAVCDDSNQGCIKVFGKGISSTIKLPKPIGIKYLQFKIGSPVLIVIDSANTIITLDLRTKSVLHSLPAQDIITSQTYCIGTDWLFVGYANGLVDVFDLELGKMTSYQIPDLVGSSGKHMVVDLQFHPTDLNTLLIGYETVAFVWSIRDSSSRASFDLSRHNSAYSETHLTCLAWHPNGTRFIAGYDDGQVHIWNLKHDQRPTLSLRLSDPTDDESPGEPIFQVSWYQTGQGSSVFVAGGLKETYGLSMFEFDDDSRLVAGPSLMALPTDLVYFVMLGTINDPWGIAVVTAQDSLHVYKLDDTFSRVTLPPALDFLDPPVLSVCFNPKVPQQVFQDLTTAPAQVLYLPLTGGVAGPDHVYRLNANDLIVTLHQGELLKFWDASYTALRPLPHLSLNFQRGLGPDAFVSCLDLNRQNGSLSVGGSDGSVLIYELSRQSSRTQADFINSCDDTLNEIAALLEEMGSDPSLSDSQPKVRKQLNACVFEKIPVPLESKPGFYLSLKITMNSPVTNLISIGDSIIAASTMDGSVHVIDIYKQVALFSHNIAMSDYQNAAVAAAYTTTDLEEQDIKPLKKPSVVTSITFHNTYLPSMTLSTQLMIGLKNGHIYQIDLSLIENKLSITPEELNTYLSMSTAEPILKSHIVDLKGKPQEAHQQIEKTLEEPKVLETNPFIEDNPEIISKRMIAIGRTEYRHQPNPHFMVGLSPHSISVYLSGFNVKLFYLETTREAENLHSTIIKYNGSVCVCVLSSLGKLSFYSIPRLDLLLDMTLPSNYLPDRLKEASLSPDGRVIYWTGKYELEQYSFVHQPNFPVGESVILYDPTRKLDPHPSSLNQNQRIKKGWLNSMTGAFQKEPMTLTELDSIMGRLPREDPDKIRKQKIEAYKTKMAKSEASSSGGVFAELGVKVNERGEKLNQLDQKFSELNDASGDFLKAIRDYNDRQAQKKWWEF